MTATEIRPHIGGQYRNRRTGEIGKLVSYREPTETCNENRAIVQLSKTDQWWGSCGDFWELFIHATARKAKP